MRTFGVELELGDVPTELFAKFAYEYQALNPEDWTDRSIQKKLPRYDRWDVQSDPTIKNTDGTVCQHTVIQNGEKVSYKKGMRHLNKGAEIITPPLEDLFEFGVIMKEFLEFASGAGAVYRPDLKHAMHIHVDISDYKLKDIKALLDFSAKEGNSFFRQFEGWYDIKFPCRKLSTEINEKIQASDDLDEIWELYRVKNVKTGEVGEVRNYAWRKDINPGNWFRAEKGEDLPATVEFRAFGSTESVDQMVFRIQECINLVDKMKVIA